MQKAKSKLDFSGLEIRDGAGFCLLPIRVTPKASRNEIQGVGEGVLRLRIQAPPVDGADNDKTRDYLAELLPCPRKQIALERGPANRNKVFRIEGWTKAEVIAALGSAATKS